MTYDFFDRYAQKLDVSESAMIAIKPLGEVSSDFKAHGVPETSIKTIVDSIGSQYVGVGVSHNNFRDKSGDIVPVKIIAEDIQRQKGWVAGGEQDGIGEFWVMHEKGTTLGPVVYRELIENTGMCLVAGPIEDDEIGAMLEGKAFTMSIGYKYLADEAGRYQAIYVYEHTVAKPSLEMNPYTWFKVFRRSG